LFQGIYFLQTKIKIAVNTQQMSYFKAKMHQNQLASPQTLLGELTELPRPPSWV